MKNQAEDLSVYFASLNHPILSRDEEVSLLEEIAANGTTSTNARNRLLDHNQRLVVSIVRHYAGRGVSMADLIQEGNLGLLRAAAKFDLARATRFGTYATWWIKQFVRKAVRAAGRSSARELAFDPTGSGPASLVNTPAPHEDNGPADDELAALNRMLETLKPREREVIEMRFGLTAERTSMTLQEIGDLFGITKERVRQIEAKALEILRGLNECA